MHFPGTRRAALVIIACALGFPFSVSGAADGETTDAPGDSEIEVVDMTPDEAPSLSMRHLATGIGSLFKGPGHYYQPHEILVETTPSGAYLDLFYVRANFQKRFEQAESPVRVLLPPRAESGERDSFRIRAFAEGYRQKSVSMKANTTEERVVIDLEPLPNELVGLGHQYFAGRTSLTFLTREPLTFRLQEGSDAVSIVLTETARSDAAEAALDSMHSPVIDQAVGQQLGEDLLVKLALTGDAKLATIDLRSRKHYDAARDLHALVIELVPEKEKQAAVTRALAALAKVRGSDIRGCRLAFEKSLRKQLDPGALSRALAPSGSFVDPYLRASMRRLGELSQGNVVVFTDGTEYDPSVLIELEAALFESGKARGYLALLRRFVDGMEAGPFRDETLRSLIAPELDPDGFAAVLEAAHASEKACRAGR